MSVVSSTSNRSPMSRSHHWLLVTELLIWFWASKVRPSFLGLADMKLRCQICIVSLKAALGLAKDYLHVQTRQWCSHVLSCTNRYWFCLCKMQTPSITCGKSLPRLETSDLLGCGTSYVVAVQVFTWSLEGDKGEDGSCSWKANGSKAGD